MSLLSSLKDSYENYKIWVKTNPQKASEAEVTFKWLSYFLSGRIHSSSIPTEAAYALSNLLVLFNDRIIQSSTTSSGGFEDKVRVLLTTLEYLEVVLEISSQKLGGNRVKWVTITVMQSVKAIMRSILLFKFNQRFVTSPALSPLNREITVECPGNKDATTYMAFQLKKSGRLIRKIEASPMSTQGRMWLRINPKVSDKIADQHALQNQVLGAALYIIRPLLHLWVTKKFGEKSWKPWMLSLVIDLVSVHFLKSGIQRISTPEERNELNRRLFLFILYAMRSPFYDRYSAERIKSFLNALSRTVPLARFICEPTKSYIPFFQSTYSYVWST